jgi:polysaccharide export outer membrane protein
MNHFIAQGPSTLRVPPCAPTGSRTTCYRWARASVVLSLLAVSGLASSGCTELAVSVTRPTPLAKFVKLSGALGAQSYRLMPGDQLTMRCYYNPQLDEDVQVRPDGNISLSLVGELRAAGRTAAELSAEITRSYAQYFVKPTAVIIVRQFSGHRVFTAGELRLPGQFSLLTGARTVLDSIAASGGVTPLGTLTHVILIRRLPSQTKPMVAELNVANALSGDDMSQDVTLMPNDFVYVPRSGAADFNEAMHMYVFRNLNFSTSASAGYGFTKQ